MTARAVHDGLFRVDPPALLGSRCASCEGHSFPRTHTCPYCGQQEPEDVVLSDTGTLWGWTEVLNPPPGYEGEVPFGFGVIELPEGVRVVTRLASPVAGYESGQPMHLRIVPLHTAADGDAVLTYEFGPDPISGAS